MEASINNRVIRLVDGDITELAIDAIVNPANQYLQLGSGVAGAIRMGGGPSIQKECDEIGFCPIGSAVITGAGNLKARYVIHAVGPHGTDSDADEKLIGATHASLSLIDHHGLESIALPAISTGVFGYPLDRCAQNMIATVIDYLRVSATSLKLVVFCLYGQRAFNTFASELQRQTAS